MINEDTILLYKLPKIYQLVDNGLPIENNMNETFPNNYLDIFNNLLENINTENFYPLYKEYALLIRKHLSIFIELIKDKYNEIYNDINFDISLFDNESFLNIILFLEHNIYLILKSIIINENTTSSIKIISKLFNYIDDDIIISFLSQQESKNINNLIEMKLNNILEYRIQKAKIDKKIKTTLIKKE